MKKYLLPENGKFYKANLHMHTNVSDGQMSPEETKIEFLKKGYSIVAFTDHEVMVPHPELTDDKFIAITATEIAVNKPGRIFEFSKCYHLNIYSKDPNKKAYYGFNEKSVWLKHSLNYLDKNVEYKNYPKEYSIECMNDIINNVKKEGCIVSYNHPVWSLQDYEDYIGFENLWGIEWFNNGCERAGYADSIKPMDDLLRKNQNVFPLATDDAHCIEDSFGGFVMVKAEKFDYETIFNALEKGDFYSSSGPEIHELYIENGILTVKTSNVDFIYLSSERRFNIHKTSTNGKLTEASFDINRYLNTYALEANKESLVKPYIRITIVDKKGKKAHTRAYFIDELV